MAEVTVNDVRTFWETNPLWTGESRFPTGSREFFEEHRRVVIDDCFGGKLDARTFPRPPQNRKVLDLGCGPGFWTIELGQRGCDELHAADLTEQAIQLAGRRCELFGVKAELCRQNAEKLTFADASFSHVNCQGVIHHTPSPESCVAEIARVLAPGGTASISVYYRNVFLRSWPYLRHVGNVFTKLGAKLPGRGREDIFRNEDPDEIVRLYDGAANPLGISYTKHEYIDMLSPHFKVEEIFYHFFPARSLPFPVPKPLHRALDSACGFMIYASLRKPS